MRSVASIEARMTSSRLPGKVLMDIAGKPMLQHVIERTMRSRSVETVVVATTTNGDDDPIIDLATALGARSFRGSEDDVLGRVVAAVAAEGAEVVIKVTGDMPLIDPGLIDAEVAFFHAGGYDYVSEIAMKNTPAWKADATFPLGFGAEIVRAEVLAEAARSTDDQKDREHVSRYIINRPDRFRLGAFAAVGAFAAAERPDVRLAVNTPAELTAVRTIVEALAPTTPAFSIFDVLALLTERPEILDIAR